MQSQVFPNNPYQTDSLYSALKVKVIKESIDFNSIFNQDVFKKTIQMTLLNDLGLPIKSKMIVTTFKSNLVSKSSEYLYNENQCTRATNFKGETVESYTLYTYDSEGRLKQSEEFKMPNEKIEMIEYSYNPIQTLSTKYEEGIVIEKTIKKYDANYFLQEVINEIYKKDVVFLTRNITSSYKVKKEGDLVIETIKNNNFKSTNEFAFAANKLLKKKSIISGKMNYDYTYFFENDNKKDKFLKNKFYDNNKKLTDSLNAKYTHSYFASNSAFNDGYIIIKDSLGRITARTEYLDMDYLIRDGSSINYFSNKKPHIEAFYVNDKLHNDYKVYYESGIVKRQEKYSYGKVLSGKCYDISGNEIDYFPSQVRPVYPNGSFEQDVTRRIKELKFSKPKQDTRVKIDFIVDTSGKVIDVVITNGFSKEIEDQLLDIMQSLPDWKPALIENKPVRYKYSLPLLFRAK
ncbi:energy transducer TonB [Flavobacterium sp. NRK F7]|uniref:energy transducer TonB n=1 Tax=Flavobacterium sp. NRK F7 TaxID=2954930 RepID=UPI002090575D|nr:energy transducer TonB [Flavobacterium sp. NRK F7]MCO6163546.1 energy transducer TonB [Flavobacterium sp. NRK F7]